MLSVYVVMAAAPLVTVSPLLFLAPSLAKCVACVAMYAKLSEVAKSVVLRLRVCLAPKP